MNGEDIAYLEREERNIAGAEAEKEAAQGRFDKAWERVFSTFDRLYGRGQAARFLCHNGMVLARQVPDPAPVLDEEKLKELLEETYTPLEAKRRWNDVTVATRRVDQSKLEKLMKNGRINADLVLRATTKRAATPSRIHKEGTKEERATLEREDEDDIGRGVMAAAREILGEEQSA